MASSTGRHDETTHYKKYSNKLLLKEHVALDRSSWSLKSVWNRLTPIIKWPTVLVRKVNRKTTQFRGKIVWIIVFYF